MKRISLLGSTGSIGKQTLQVAEHLGAENVRVIALAVHKNIDLLEKQIHRFRPLLSAVYDEAKAKELQSRVGNLCPIIAGMEGLCAVASHQEADFVLSGISGSIGLLPTIEAIKAKKEIGLANKEVLVAGGDIIADLLRCHQVSLIPVDSEHSALFQCLRGETKSSIRRLILTASGGPFRLLDQERLQRITAKEALAHPNWLMGAKVTIDSSTLMNKGLEVIEAHYLFGIECARIDVVIHPQSIIHSMVEFVDSSIKAQMSLPDMLVPIQYALTYPDRHEGLLSPFDFSKMTTLELLPPDLNRFPCLRMAYDALKRGGLSPCFLNAANEVLVTRFLYGEIGWLDIADRLDRLMDKFQPVQKARLADVLEVDAQARQEAKHI